MRFRRRTRGSFRSRGSREPLMWDRAEVLQRSALGFGVVDFAVLFDPSTIVAGNQDLRVTVRRVLLYVSPFLVFSAAVAQALVFGMGIYIKRVGEPARDPLLAAAADQRADWMALQYKGVVVGAGAQTTFLGVADTLITGGARSSLLFDVRAMRKMDQDEQLVLCHNDKRIDAADFAAPTETARAVNVESSVLYSRTKR